jgi:hypothetical protein
VLLFVKYVSDKAASLKTYDIEVPKGGSFADMVALKGDKEIGDKMNKIIAKLAERTTSRASSTSPTGTTPTSWARARRWSTACPTWSASSTPRPRLPRQPRRGRRPPRRRLRVPDAALRHREWQEQGPVLHAGRGVADHGQGHRRRRGEVGQARRSTTRPVARARCCSRPTTRPRAPPATTSPSTARRWTTPPRRWPR